MAVLVEVEFSGVTAQQYDTVDQRVGARAERPPEGLLFHTAIITDTGLRVVDLWESTEACEAFIANRLQPVIREVGYPEPSSEPKFSNVHYHFERRQQVDA
ncbi:MULTISPECIES: hypothetical protein [Streptomyces]|uniref:ABM domain-containing protein n=1 Tax=Streptomyces chartreusis NRRL 3882 TaxID=1079985 RepID=A0A2N9AZZ8_STRCX|nr:MULTISPECIES: hypothetical protein [Streptomyces]MYS91941.1 hypothetical protein [Streptomyces sp. SID5464]SOR76649.1 hypothetical protein SCNRRL3882_0132 [Streptomyces chartreusis NRRL 3882]